MLFPLTYNREFEVESLHFPGQTHRWQVSGWLQKGSEKAHNSLLDDVALALSLIVVTAKNRVASPLFSLSHSLHSLWQGILMLVGELVADLKKSVG